MGPRVAAGNIRTIEVGSRSTMNRSSNSEPDRVRSRLTSAILLKQARRGMNPAIANDAAATVVSPMPVTLAGEQAVANQPEESSLQARRAGSIHRGSARLPGISAMGPVGVLHAESLRGVS